MRGDGEAFSEALSCSSLEYPMVPAGERDHPWQLRPSEPDRRRLARPVDRVGPPQVVPVVIVLPFLRLVVDADRRLQRVAQVHMVAEREAAEAKLSGDFPEHRSELPVHARGAYVVDKGTNPFEHAETLRFRTVTRGVPKRRAHVPPS